MCFIYQVQRTNTKNSYRQLGLIGNLVNTQSRSDCRQILNNPASIGNAYEECMIANDKLNQLPGAAQKILFRMLEEMAHTVFKTQTNEHVFRYKVV